MWIVDDMAPRLLAAWIAVPMGLWAGRGSDATRGAGRLGLGTSAGLVPSDDEVRPQPLPSTNHRMVSDGGEGEMVRPNRHGSSGSAR